MAEPRIDILMYHSISDNPGPTNIAPAVFRAQIAALAASGLEVITMDRLADRGAGELPGRCVVITFDDGYQDFADIAWPILKGHGMEAINYVPTGYLGGTSEFDTTCVQRPIMSMETVRDLARDGAQIGSHTVSHPHLTRLFDDVLEAELARSKEVLEDALGRPVRHIAPPFGAANLKVTERIAGHYATSVTTRFAVASAADPLLALPRVEMYYFQDSRRWRGFLDGKMGYFRFRRAMREVGKLRELVQ